MYDDVITQKFWAGVQKGDGCWVYAAQSRKFRRTTGYRYFWIDGIGAVPSHKFAFEVTYGPVPDGQLVRHRCAVRSCCRPDHMLSGTYEENTWDIQVRIAMKIAPGELATYEDFPEWRPRRLRK